MKENPITIHLGFVNAYLLKAGDGFVLIDTGMPGQWHVLKNRLDAEGCFPGRIKLVIVTHADMDHVGNCLRIKENYGAPIAVHSLDVPILETGLPPKRSSRTFSGKLFMGFINLIFFDFR